MLDSPRPSVFKLASLPRFLSLVNSLKHILQYSISLLMLTNPVTNWHRIRGLKPHPFIISQFLQVRNSVWIWLGSPTRPKSRWWPGCSLAWRTSDEQSSSKLMQTAGRIQVLYFFLIGLLPLFQPKVPLSFLGIHIPFCVAPSIFQSTTRWIFFVLQFSLPFSSARSWWNFLLLRNYLIKSGMKSWGCF